MRPLDRIARRLGVRSTLFFSAIVFSTSVSCAPSKPAAPPTKVATVSPPLFQSSPLESVAKRGLSWFVSFRPKTLFSTPNFSARFARVVHDEEFAAYASNHANIDLRALEHLVIANYSTSTLAITTGVNAPGTFDAFSKRVSHLEHVAVGPYLYDQGRGTTHLERIGKFGSALYYEWGRAPHALLDAIHLAEAPAKAPAQEQVSLPAAKALVPIRDEIPPALLAVLERSPACLYLRGPFDQAWASSLKGLLRAATGMALCATSENDALEVELFVVGDYSRDLPGATGLLRESLLSLREAGWMSRMFVLRGEPRPAPVDGGLAMRVTLDQQGFFETLAELTRDEVRDFAAPAGPATPRVQPAQR